MKCKLTEERRIVKIENNFIFQQNYKMPALEQKVMLCLISSVDTKAEKFYEKLIPVTDIQAMLTTGSTVKWGSFYERLENLTKRLFDSGVVLESELIKEVKRRRSFFEIIEPAKDKGGALCIRFVFSRWMEPHLLNLKKYVQFQLSEVVPMKSGHSIRIYMMLRAYRESKRAFEKVSRKSYQIDELQKKLLLHDKYTGKYGPTNFQKKVVDRAVEEINTCSPTIFVTYDKLKTGRKFTGFEFAIFDVPRKDNVSEHDIGKLTRAELKAYEGLVAFGVFPGIVYHRLLPEIKSGLSDGFEDVFVNLLIQYIKDKAKIKTPGTLVKWLLNPSAKGKEQTYLIKIGEQVRAHAKKLEKEKPENFYNRMEAKGMTNSEFEAVKKNKRNEENKVSQTVLPVD